MPRGDPDPRPRVFERLVLQPLGPQPQGATELEQPLLVGAHEMHHPLASHRGAGKHPAAVEGEAHPLAAACELPIGWCYWQVMRPSDVAGATGVAAPENRAPCRPGAQRLVGVADQPAGGASLMTSTTPADARKLPMRAKLDVYFALS